MTFHVVIPARYESSRLPGKPLKIINGASMIQRVYQQALASGAASVVVATDDERILQHVESFGGKAVMTSKDHESGTDRIYEAGCKAGFNDDEIVVNVQGDEPFIPPQVIAQTAALLKSDSSVMSTLCTPISDEEEVTNPNVVKVIKNTQGKAIYFSRSVIPFDREDSIKNYEAIYLRHLGIYGFKFSFLKQFSQLPASQLESIEKLEQLRVLENGFDIEIAIANHTPPVGVDTEQDYRAACALAEKQEGLRE